nr:reverse transcriptase [Tanacetum cinerariifolium]
MESIHVNFVELPLMASEQVSSDPAPKCQTMALEHDSLSPAIQRQTNVPQTDRTVTTSNELDLLFSLMFDELLNGSSKVINMGCLPRSACLRSLSLTQSLNSLVLGEDNARSSSVGVVGSMLTSFDGKLKCIFRFSSRPFAKKSLETNCYDFWTSSVVTVLYDSPRAFSAASFVMVKLTVEFLRLMLRVLAVFVYWSIFPWVLKLFQDASDDTWAGCLKAIQNGKELLGLDIDGNQIPQSQPSELALLSNE